MIEEIVKKLKRQIKDAKAMSYDTEHNIVSWEREQGVLIPINQAQSLVDFIEGKEKEERKKAIVDFMYWWYGNRSERTEIKIEDIENYCEINKSKGEGK